MLFFQNKTDMTVECLQQQRLASTAAADDAPNAMHGRPAV